MITITGGGFKAELQRRRERLSTAGPVGVLLWAPDSVRWWYFQEFGTAGGYSIDPVNAKLLRWPEPSAQGGWRTATHVTHPGVPATKFVSRVLADIEAMAGTSIMNALLGSDYDMAAVQAALLDEIGPEAKRLIVESMAEQLPQKRAADTGGKLDGESPADVFDAATELRPLT